MRHYIKMLRCAGVGLGLSLACFTVVAHNGHGDELPWQACSEAKKNDPCEYTNSHNNLFRGHCKTFNEALMCVRNQPIIQLKNASVKAKGKSDITESSQH